MAVAVGVGDLGNQHAQADGVFAQPEGHRVEDMAQKPGMGEEADLGWLGQIVLDQDIADPCSTPALPGWAAVVGIVECAKGCGGCGRRGWGFGRFRGSRGCNRRRR